MPRRRKEPFGLYKRDGTDIWQIDFTIKGRNRLRTSSGTSNKARAREIAETLYAREHERNVKGDRLTITFPEAVMLYIDRGGSSRFTRRLVEHFKNQRVASIHPGDIRAASLEIYPSAAPATRNRQVIGPTRAIINAAADAGLCSHIRVRNFKVQKPERRAVSAEWLAAFRQLASPRVGALALLMATTAARIGEAIKLTWNDVDLTNGTAKIPAAKGQEARVAFLPAELVAALANIPKHSTNRVFGFKERKSVYKHWRAACEAASIDYVPPHQAGRHTFATMMLAAGVDVRTIAERGGWKSPTVLLNTYTHNDAGKEAIERAFSTFASRLGTKNEK